MTAQLTRNHIGAEVKRLWFNSAAVLDAVDEAKREELSRFGYYTMRDARQSIRKRKRPARPGESPTNQTTLLKRFIYFAYEPETSGVITGPARLAGARGSAFIPKTLEEGDARIEARPYMKPAHARQLTKQMPRWRDAVK